MRSPKLVTIASPDELLTPLAELIVEWPLYKTLRFEGNFSTWIGEGNRVRCVYLPDEISKFCVFDYCRHVQLWALQKPEVGMMMNVEFHDRRSEFVEVQYKCKNCGSLANCWFFFSFWRSDGWIEKVGQYPPLEREPSNVLAGALSDEDLGLYRHALTTRNSNFGIGAVAYLRRIVENRINDLLDLVAEAATADDPDSPLLKEVEAVKADRRFSEKIELAAKLLPKSLTRDGNPVAMLHDLTSAGLHGESDEECVETFDRCKLAFEYVVQRLKEAHDEDSGYRTAIRALLGRKAKTTT